jgi:hypothetical protein
LDKIELGYILAYFSQMNLVTLLPTDFFSMDFQCPARKKLHISKIKKREQQHRVARWHIFNPKILI